MSGRPVCGDCQQEIDERRDQIATGVFALFQAAGLRSYHDVVEATVSCFARIALDRETPRPLSTVARGAYGLEEALRNLGFPEEDEEDNQPEPDVPQSEPDVTLGQVHGTYRIPRNGQNRPRGTFQPNRRNEHRGRHGSRPRNQQHQEEQPPAQEVRSAGRRGHPPRRQPQGRRPTPTHINDPPAYTDLYIPIRRPPPSYGEAVGSQRVRPILETLSPDVRDTQHRNHADARDILGLLPERMGQQDQGRQEARPEGGRQIHRPQPQRGHARPHGGGDRRRPQERLGRRNPRNGQDARQNGHNRATTRRPPPPRRNNGDQAAGRNDHAGPGRGRRSRPRHRVREHNSQPRQGVLDIGPPEPVEEPTPGPAPTQVQQLVELSTTEVNSIISPEPEQGTTGSSVSGSSEQQGSSLHTPVNRVDGIAAGAEDTDIGTDTGFDDWITLYGQEEDVDDDRRGSKTYRHLGWE